MIKKVDSTPTRMMDKSELIEKVYNLSDEIENLNKRIKQYKNKIELLKKRQRPTIKIVEKIVHVYDMNHVDKNDNDLDNAIDFAVELTGVERKYIMEKRRTGQQVVARSIVYKILYAKGYSLKQIGKMFDKHYTNILHGLQQYDNVVSDPYKYHTHVYISNRDKE